MRQFLRNESISQEPWDGPAALVFTDGRYVGAKLDRNGLRPLRYTITTDGLIILGSEAGLVDWASEAQALLTVHARQRIGPGEMLVVDTAAKKILTEQEIAELLSNSNGAGNKIRSARLKRITVPPKPTPEPRKVAAALGWSEDQLRMLLQSLATEAKESVWSMGDDAPPAFLSAMRRPIWDYCKQRFAQVTNPPIDPLREGHVMSLEVHLGKSTTIASPLLDESQLATLESQHQGAVLRIDITYEAAAGVAQAAIALDKIREEADKCRANPAKIILLSDRQAGSS